MNYKRMLIWPLIIVIGFFIVLTSYVYFNQHKMVFFPTKSIDATPEEVGLSFEDVYIKTVDNKKLHGWYIKADSSDKPNRYILFCHGNAGNISHRLTTAVFLKQLGVNTLLFDYQGYGNSEGSATEQNIYDDTKLFFDWLVSQKGAKEEEIFLFGRSLGGAPAIDLAVKSNCGGLIVESSFTSADDMGKMMFPFLPIQYLIKYKLNSIDKIDKVNCPILFTHSPDDEIVPFWMGKKLFEKAVEPKLFLEISSGHNDRLYLENSKYITTLKTFIFGSPEKGTNLAN